MWHSRSAIGVLVGLVVLALEHAVDDVLHELFEARLGCRPSSSPPVPYSPQSS